MNWKLLAEPVGHTLCPQVIQCVSGLEDCETPGEVNQHVMVVITVSYTVVMLLVRLLKNLSTR